MGNKQYIGIDLGGTNIRIGLVENGVIRKFVSKKISSQEKKDVILKELIDSIEEIINEDVLGIGIGVPSIVDIEKGIVYEVHNIPSWDEVRLKEILREKFNIQVAVNNDVNCFVLGEKYFGKGKQYKNVVGLAMGTGLGGGIIIDGKIYSGLNGGAGEFGLMHYLDKNYEFYCSGQFFKEVHGCKGEDILEMAKLGEDKAISIFSEFGEHVGSLINDIMYALNPEIFILGGSVSTALPFFKNSMINKLKSHEFKTQLNEIKIEQSILANSAVLGATMLLGV